MTIVVLLFLAVIWAAVLVPPLLRSRAETRPADSVGNFRHQLRVLQRTAPRAVAPAYTLRAPSAARRIPSVGPAAQRARRARTLKRRRDVLLTLLAAMAGSLVLGFFPGLRVLWGLHLVLDGLFVAYVGLLVHMRNVAAEKEMKLRFLPGPVSAPEPAFLLRRSAN